MNFDIVKTNIANYTADAIVLPANPALLEGSGASTAIFEAAGRTALTKACSKIGRCEVGCATATLGYKLKAKYIIHAVVPKWRGGKHDEYGLLSSAYLSALNIAEQLDCESVAFPLLASGNNGFDPELAFQIAKSSIGVFAGKNLKKVILVVYDRKNAEMVQNYGYTVTEIPVDFAKLKAQAEHRAKIDNLLKVGKNIAQKFAEDQLQKGIDYLQDPDNREKIMQLGFNIAKVALEHGKQPTISVNMKK